MSVQFCPAHVGRVLHPPADHGDRSVRGGAGRGAPGGAGQCAGHPSGAPGGGRAAPAAGTTTTDSCCRRGGRPDHVWRKIEAGEPGGGGGGPFGGRRAVLYGPRLGAVLLPGGENYKKSTLSLLCTVYLDDITCRMPMGT